MNMKRLVALAVLIAFIAMLAPVPRALADGKASTRNILIGGAAAALIILNHNKKVHQRYAEDAQRQAALASQRDDAWAAYRSEVQAYNHEANMVAELNKEVAYQHSIIQQQRQQLASANANRTVAMPAPLTAPAGSHAARTSSHDLRVASADGSLGWGVW